MGIAIEAERLMALAKLRTLADREQLLVAIIDLCDSAANAGALDVDAVDAVLSDIFMALVVEAEHEIRRRLAEKLASTAWAPRTLITILALDDIDIARPIIASSPVLTDRDLIRLLVEATIEHQIEVARRPALGPLVVDAILAQDEPAVLTALAGNDTARISPDGMAHLVEASRRTPSLRSSLARHARLTTPLAERLYVWVGQALRASLVSRFPIDAEALDRAIADAVSETYADPFAEPTSAPAAEPGAEREEMERRLIAKLDSSGQLRPGYLLRALKEGKLSLFEASLAKLSGFTSEQVRLAINCDHPELLALACASVGVDRSVFPTLLNLVRDLNQGRPSGAAESAHRAMGAFGPQSGGAAAIAFRRPSAWFDKPGLLALLLLP